jgi:glycosyltransferase involved in cell wall biosynthesis
MKLSIITINYNNAEGLRKTLASVAAQTYANIEHIIVDGASTDGSVDVIREYVKASPQPSPEGKGRHIIWSSEPDNGIYNAMNKGIEIALGRRVVNSLNRPEFVEDKNKGREMDVNAFNRSERSEDKNCGICKATGEYVQILNSGDLLAAPDVTERMMAALHQTSNIQHSTLENGFFPAIFYGNMLKSYDGKTIISRDTCGGKMYTPESFLYFYKGTLNHDCAYIRRDLFEKYGLYNEDMKICSDWEWYVRAIVLGGEKPIYTNIDVTIFDMNGVSESHGKNAELIKKERREYLESILPPAVLHDYDQFAFPLLQYQRLMKHHLWGLVHFMERVLFKLEKWGFVR